MFFFHFFQLLNVFWYSLVCLLCSPNVVLSHSVSHAGDLAFESTQNEWDCDISWFWVSFFYLLFRCVTREYSASWNLIYGFHNKSTRKLSKLLERNQDKAELWKLPSGVPFWILISERHKRKPSKLIFTRFLRNNKFSVVVFPRRNLIKTFWCSWKRTKWIQLNLEKINNLSLFSLRVLPSFVDWNFKRRRLLRSLFSPVLAENLWERMF